MYKTDILTQYWRKFQKQNILFPNIQIQDLSTVFYISELYVYLYIQHPVRGVICFNFKLPVGVSCIN